MNTQVIAVEKLQDFLNKIKVNNRIINIIPHTYAKDRNEILAGAGLSEGEKGTKVFKLQSVLVIYQEV